MTLLVQEHLRRRQESTKVRGPIPPQAAVLGGPCPHVFLQQMRLFKGFPGNRGLCRKAADRKTSF